MANPIRHATSTISRFSRRHALSALAAVLIFGAASTTALHSSTSPVATSPYATDLEIRMWQLINSDRTSSLCIEETRGRAKPLQWDNRLAAVARAHSQELARNGSFSHEGADGSLPSARISRAGIQWRSMGENIAEAHDVAQAEALLMNEPKFRQNHRANILKSDYTHVGVGIAIAPDGMLYITQDFVQLP